MASASIGGAVRIQRILVASAWPYVNYVPHLGTTIQLLSTDVAARYYRLKGEKVLMVSGSDEHGTPTEVAAIKQGLQPKQLTDKNHAKIVELCERWAISFDNYTRTESPVHKRFVQELMLKLYKNGYIFTQETELPYCEKCKRYLPDRFVEGRCPYCGYEKARGDQCEECGRLLDPTTLVEPYCAICRSKPVTRKTKHWFFDLSRFQEKLENYIRSNKQLPSNARNFSLNWIKEGLRARTLTRDITWGIPAPFPEAEGKSIYVWFDAVLGYVSAAIEYYKDKENPEEWREFWFGKDAKTIFFIGKDNIPFHTIILPALLLGTEEGYNLPWNVSTTEFLQIKEQKLSKSQRVGIFVDEALEMFPPDYWRFFLISTRPETKDVNFTWELFREKINADLNDTFGNFVHRTLTFINTQFDGQVPKPEKLDEDAEKLLNAVKEKVQAIAVEIEECRLQAAANTVISLSRMGNQYLNEKEPWNLIKQNREEAAAIFYVAAQIVKALAIVSAPFIPFTADEIWRTLNLKGSVHEQRWNEALELLPANHKIGKPKPLFQKIKENEEQLEEKLAAIRKKLTEKD
ncbi:MAG: methionine--tRNA ligase [Candidatus Bathyarchaeia archaeon]